MKSLWQIKPGRFVAAAVLIAACGVLLAYICRLPKVTTTVAEADGAILVSLSAKNSHRDHVVVVAEVTNNRATPIDWDTEFAVPLHWKVLAGSEPLQPEKVETLGPVPEIVSRQRFKRLLPGESLEKEIELTQAVRQFSYGHVWLNDKRGHYHVPDSSEALVRFKIPETTYCLQVILQSNLNWEFAGGFWKWFGFYSDSLILTKQDFQTQALTINLRK